MLKILKEGKEAFTIDDNGNVTITDDKLKESFKNKKKISEIKTEDKDE